MLNSPLYFCLSVNFKIKYFLNVLVHLALGSGASLERAWGSRREFLPVRLTLWPHSSSPRLQGADPKGLRLGVLHVRGHGEAPGLPELAHPLQAPCPPNPTEPTRDPPGPVLLAPTRLPPQLLTPFLLACSAQATSPALAQATHYSGCLLLALDLISA